VTYTAWTFVLTSLHTGRPVGFGLICPDAQFVGRLLCASGTNPALEHRQPTPTAWQDLRHELSLGIGVAPLARTSAIHQALASDDSGLNIQYLSHQLIALAAADEVAAMLERFLARQVEGYEAR